MWKIYFTKNITTYNIKKRIVDKKLLSAILFYSINSSFEWVLTTS